MRYNSSVLHLECTTFVLHLEMYASLHVLTHIIIMHAHMFTSIYSIVFDITSFPLYKCYGKINKQCKHSTRVIQRNVSVYWMKFTKNLIRNNHAKNKCVSFCNHWFRRSRRFLDGTWSESCDSHKLRKLDHSWCK